MGVGIAPKASIAERGPVGFPAGGTDGTGSPGGWGAIPIPIENRTNRDAQFLEQSIEER